MGISVFKVSGCYCDPTLQNKQTGPVPIIPPPKGNPNPKNFSILKTETIGQYVIAKIQYPDAKNFEGTKILVYQAKLEHLVYATELDPHFCDSGHISPIARFIPTNAGWAMARKFVKSL